MSDLLQLDALGTRGAYRAERRLAVNDIAGQPLAELSLVPRLFVHRSLSDLHAARGLDADTRARALVQAGSAFRSGTINGLDGDAYEKLVCRVSGLPISVVRAATHAIAESAIEASAAVQHARPEAAVCDWRDPLTRLGRAVWTRRGDVFAVHAAGNHPGVHSIWLEALALGYRVAVRPSTREPFTPHRLISALREAGFGNDQVALLPTDHSVADEVIAGADLAMVYGGDDVMQKYAGSSRVLAQGPGRSKVLLATSDWEPYLDTIVASVADQGGTACINASAVFVRGDPTPLAEALAAKLAAIPTLRPDDERAVLPAQPIEMARSIEKLVLAHAKGTRAWLGGDGIVEPLVHGGAVLRPAVFQTERVDAPQTRIELGFPCVWVAPWSEADGVEPLKNTLVLTAIVDDEALVQQLVDEPSISNVYTGKCPTCRIRAGVPHDRYLAEFLMRTKAVIRD
ncbi:MAG: aldehyde dehydrogenase family protein [Myxococcota bacterium]